MYKICIQLNVLVRNYYTFGEFSLISVKQKIASMKESQLC